MCVCVYEKIKRKGVKKVARSRRSLGGWEEGVSENWWFADVRAAGVAGINEEGAELERLRGVGDSAAAAATATRTPWAAAHRRPRRLHHQAQLAERRAAQYALGAWHWSVTFLLLLLPVEYIELTFYIFITYHFRLYYNYIRFN